MGIYIPRYEIHLTMPLNYHLQELPNLQEGGQKHFPKLDTYTAFNNKKMVKRIALESGMQEGAVLAVLDALPKALKKILLEGHTCKIDGLGTFSLSLAYDDKEQVGINRMNLKVDQAFIKELREEAELIKTQSEVVPIAYSKGHMEEHLQQLIEWLQTHPFITLQEYANLTGLSTSTASRELKVICSNSENGITTSGKATRKIWVKM